VTTDAAYPTGDRLAQLLAAGVRGEVDVSTRRRAEYSTDASNYRVVPAAVVFPRSIEDALALLEVCRQHGLALTSRGGGTSIAGNAIGPGVVLEFSRHLNRVLTVDAAARTAVVEPGVILDDLQLAAAPAGLRFGPDPSTHARCTLGGMIGNNACGPRALAAGKTADNVLALDVVTGTGQRLTAAAGEPVAVPGVDGVINANLATIRTELGRFDRQVSGYSLEHLLPERGRDLAKALVGTEGTCAVVLGATVRLVPAPPATALAVLGYADMASAADAVPGLLPHAPLAMEGLDSRLVEVVRARKGPGSVPALPRGGGWLLVETGGETTAAAVTAARRLVADGAALGSMVFPAGPEAVAMWRIREDGAGLAGRTATGEPAWPGWEDAAVPPAVLGAYLREFTGLLASYRLDGLAYGHFGDGCVHVRIDFPLREPARFRSFLLDAARLVASYGGSLSGEHGDGRARSDLLPLMYSPAALAAFAGFKAAFDPDNVLNPGVLVAPRPVEADLRLPAAGPVPAASTPLGFSYAGDHEDFTAAVHRCVGVGKCRADLTARGTFMCPSYLATRDEKDSTRGRSRVLQEMVNGSIVRGGWRSPEVHEALELCLACKACAADCPAEVDMATYKAEVLYQTYRRRLRPAGHYTLGWLPRWAALVAGQPGLANAVLRPRPVAAAAKRLGGIDRHRALPAFAAETFRQQFARRPPPGAGDSVLLWVDTFTNSFSPEVGLAAVDVLESLGFQVQIPAARVCCGLTWLTTGQLDGARRQLRRALNTVSPQVAAGMPVVGLEPSCTALLRSDVADLLPTDPRAAALAAATRTLAEFLAEHRPDWQPPALTGTEIVVQPHCHHHAVMGYGVDRALLARTGATLHPVAGCCGLAGNFGVERGRFAISRQIAEHALLPAVRAAGPDAVVLADGYSCRTQLDQLAGRRGLHLAQLLAGTLAAG
jgi:FAD/FMN-containing dehydrogenase/Fe-S oxidoreductase